jgi:hypothetical protein
MYGGEAISRCTMAIVTLELRACGGGIDLPVSPLFEIVLKLWGKDEMELVAPTCHEVLSFQLALLS